MGAIVPQNPDGASPFDVIRRFDDMGECWSARDLMPLLGYLRWEDFRNATERAILSVGNSGHDSDQHISERPEITEGSRKPRVNYRLTRYGAYMIAMNGGPRKEEVAAAQKPESLRWFGLSVVRTQILGSREISRATAHTAFTSAVCTSGVMSSVRRSQSRSASHTLRRGGNTPNSPTTASAMIRMS